MSDGISRVAENPRRDFEALVLTGGGLAGAVYHMAVLAALEAADPGFDSRTFGAYLGSSAGATVCALVGGGIAPAQLLDSFRSGDDYFPLRTEHLFPRSRFHVVRSLLRLAASALSGLFSHRWLMTATSGTTEPHPASGLFSTSRYEAFLGAFMLSEGIPTSFRDFPRRLYIPGFDLDLADRVIFGREPWADVPIPLAVSASSAIPLFYRPVEVSGRWIIDGDTGCINHLDVLLKEGMRTFLLVNPAVPLRNDATAFCLSSDDGRPGRLHERGMLAVWSQASRVLSRNQLHAELRRQFLLYPDMEVTLIEPPMYDTESFVVHSMNVEMARSLAGHATRSIRARFDAGGWAAFDARKQLLADDAPPAFVRRHEVSRNGHSRNGSRRPPDLRRGEGMLTMEEEL